jgi:hypothetical protein
VRTWLLLLLGVTACNRPEEAPIDQPSVKAMGELDTETPASPDTPTAAIRAYEQVMISTDSAALAALWDAGPGADTVTRASQLRQIAAPGTARLDSITALSGPNVKVIGDSATASGKVGAYGNEDGKDVYHILNYTYSLRKRGGAWKITAAMFYPRD